MIHVFAQSAGQVAYRALTSPSNIRACVKAASQGAAVIGGLIAPFVAVAAAGAVANGVSKVAPAIVRGAKSVGQTAQGLAGMAVATAKAKAASIRQNRGGPDNSRVTLE